ncbi:hypothetical protein SCP_1400550 [Sparassis crispa]|uniref:Uncharacterized protein n=1 Tax=Sparassis crispa TaxID=139825 RepID=A0A401H2R0_9APHY|nr:hypothetical protein SCP_1400550 [Sparassis crispa]GBE88650.1 hypothetical protein SCP_1400550 [Sparassis crispa]
MGPMFGVALPASTDTSSTVEPKSEQTMPQAQVDSIDTQVANDDAEPDTKAPKGTPQPATLRILVGVVQTLQAVISSDLELSSLAHTVTELMMSTDALTKNQLKSEENSSSTQLSEHVSKAVDPAALAELEILRKALNLSLMTNPWTMQTSGIGNASATPAPSPATTVPSTGTSAQLQRPPLAYTKGNP